MKPRYQAILLSCLLALALSGCGGSTTSSTSTAATDIANTINEVIAITTAAAPIGCRFEPTVTSVGAIIASAAGGPAGAAAGAATKVAVDQVAAQICSVVASAANAPKVQALALVGSPCHGYVNGVCVEGKFVGK